MALPEWGYSYNALSVPLTSDWQCSLVPARDVGEPTSWWDLSYFERQQKREDREKQIEQDRRDFDRLFRVDTHRRAARACSDFSVYTAFIGEHLSHSGLPVPVDGEGVTRILRGAVRDGWLIPAIDRTWRGSRRVGRSYAPQSWPERAPDPKPIVYGVLNGEFVPLNADGFFVDHTPYVPVKARAALAASNSAGSSGGSYWPDVVEETVGAVLGGDDGPFVADNLTDGSDTSTLFGDAQPFEYFDDSGGGSVMDLAARGVSETDEAECFSQYERDMDLCRALGGPMGGSRGQALCEKNAFDNYQQCRGY